MADIITKRNGYGTGIDDALYEMDDNAMELMGFQDEDLAILGFEVCEAAKKITEEVLEESK